MSTAMPGDCEVIDLQLQRTLRLGQGAELPEADGAALPPLEERGPVRSVSGTAADYSTFLGGLQKAGEKMARAVEFCDACAAASALGDIEAMERELARLTGLYSTTLQWHRE